ncbi:hypothetical protein BCR32DRAFT_289817 [Anaeromyces robustus]|uniref:Uncharacterized protein n=1 Tax=Anaeromyces robustus TaxID=1754192 RepID=A0A1Y1XM01_9FUNG|nr:hypothetical protein BCR32DRAFT_289817 [Anaeromyces robustus]|eukprot:ORX86751.1 hypothetical protein BCR32DRAFT_289817 [Anaeromyces robustus]
MKKKCFVPDSIPELQKKNISINIGRPAKITARKPAEQILIEKEYQKFLGHLIIQNETLTQLKKEIEYKLKKLKDEEASLNLLQKKYNRNKNENYDNNNNNNNNKNGYNKDNKKNNHINLFKNAQKEWEERKQELIKGDYINIENNELQNLIDTHLFNNNVNFSLDSNSLMTDDSSLNYLSNINDYDYSNNTENNNNNFNSNTYNLSSTESSQINKPFSFSPDFSLSSFNLDNIDNLDPNLMNLDIDFDMNLLDINLPRKDEINFDINDNLIKTVNDNNENINHINNDDNNNYLEADISKILQEISNNSESSLENDIMKVNLSISKVLDEMSSLQNITNTEASTSISTPIINELDTSNISNISELNSSISSFQSDNTINKSSNNSKK